MPVAPRNDAEARQYVYDNFGAMAYWLNDPELGPLLMSAGYDRWSESKVQTALMGTNWWRTRTAAQREFYDLENSDPSEARFRVEQNTATVRDMAMQLGLRIDPSGIARQMTEMGLNEAQIRDMLASMVTMAASGNPGQVGTWMAQVKAQAADYFVDETDEAALQWAKQIAAGDFTPEDMKAFYAQRAKERYTYLADVIDQGVSVRQYFEGHRNQIAKTLEISPEEVNMMNGKYAAVTRTIDVDTGKERAMTESEAARWARQQDEWQRTDNAKNIGANMITTLGQAFGKL